MILSSNLDEKIPIVCNTEDDVIFSNISAAVERHLPWLGLTEPHDKVAVIVGGGPSMKGLLPLISAHKLAGHTVFAVNGVIPSLLSVDVTPDYFVLLDAREDNLSFLHPDLPVHNLIASQCPPSVFKALEKQEITVWHPAYPGIADYIGDRECALIGGGTTVGLQAMSIAFAMGYREIHLFGFDSSYSHVGEGHAYAQAVNDDDPRDTYRVGKLEYVAAPWMARQAVEFQEAARQLADADAEIHVHGRGLLPAIARAMSQPPEEISEVDKYKAMWGIDSYRTVAPGENFADEFIDMTRLGSTSSVIDFGCGSGRGSKKIYETTGCQITQVDFAENCRDAGNDLPFEVVDLCQPIVGLKADFGYCTDVMEHIPTDKVPDVIKNIMDCVDRCFFKIAMFPDSMGSLIGHSLHLSVFPIEWWEEQFSDYKISYRQCDRDTPFPYATFYVEKDLASERN